MPHIYSHREYANMVFVYGFCNGNARSAVREYRQRFPRHRVPSRKVFVTVFNKLCDSGKLPSTHIRSERASRQEVDEVENILDLVEENRGTSSRRISAQLEIPQTRVIRTLHEHGLYPYHIQRVQHLQPGDHARRVQFCRWINANRNLVPCILFTDESTFTRDGINNTRNSHRWSDENPHATVETNFQHRFSVNVWCGIVDNYLIGPFIFENNLSGENYLLFLQNDLQALLDDIPLNIRQALHYQLDGAPPHYANQVRQHLNRIFPGRWIGRGGPISWPARSPDLTPLDFCLWGWLKSEVYKLKVDNRDALILRIMNAAAHIREQQDELRKATSSLRKRARKCLEVHGDIFENLL